MEGTETGPVKRTPSGWGSAFRVGQAPEDGDDAVEQR